MVIVTEEHLQMVELAGACESARKYRPGTDLSKVSASDLAWCEDKFPDVAIDLARLALRESRIRARGFVPLALLGSGAGSGNGDGNGSGDGSGYGDGNGSGSGYGSGSGSGDGSGYGASAVQA